MILAKRGFLSLSMQYNALVCCYNSVTFCFNCDCSRKGLVYLLRLITIVLYLVSALGCGVLTTTTKLPPRPTFQTASLEQLVEKIQRFATINSMKAVVEIRITVQFTERKEEVRYRDIRGALVIRRPDWIRTSAQSPGGIATLFDMVSDGTTFQVHLPLRNRVYEGENELNQPSENWAENIRPQHIRDAIMLDPIQNRTKVLLDSVAYGQTGYQVVIELVETKDKGLRIKRKYWFDRADLQLSRMLQFNEKSEVTTDTWYGNWLEVNELPYPGNIRIDRPSDGYRLEINILKQELNEDIPDTSFVLTLPADVEILTVGENDSSPS